MTHGFNYYVLDDSGEPLAVDDVIVWAHWFQTADRVLRVDTIGDVKVSTVFLGIDHGWNPQRPPVLWETMIFGGPLDQECSRYSSRADAIAGHELAVSRVGELTR